MRGGDDSFTNNVMFWSASQATANGDVPVNPDAEAHRIATQQGGGAAPVTAPASTTAPAPTPPPADDDKDSGGWFDWF